MTQPTHDEVIVWIDERVAKLNELINNPCDWGIETEIEYRASLLANRDVLVRHEGETEFFVSVARDEPAKNGERQVCRVCDELFPCPTVLDIAQRLDEVM